ncbi:hypothetical protein X777_12457, partial [Ooceraea biroi]
EYKLWLREVPNNANLVFCIICDTFITGGLSQIHRHAESKLHITNCGKNDANKWNEDFETQIDESHLTYDEQRKLAEIRFAALMTEKNIPYQTANEILSLFQDIGKNPHVLKGMNMGRTKYKNIICTVLCPVETERVVRGRKQTLASLNFDNMRKKIFISDNLKYPNSRSLVNAIGSLPHSNVDPERIFSILPDVKTKKRNRLSSTNINATCVLKSALKTRGKTALNIKLIMRTYVVCRQIFYMHLQQKNLQILLHYMVQTVILILLVPPRLMCNDAPLRIVYFRPNIRRCRTPEHQAGEERAKSRRCAPKQPANKLTGS